MNNCRYGSTLQIDVLIPCEVKVKHEYYYFIIICSMNIWAYIMIHCEGQSTKAMFIMATDMVQALLNLTNDKAKQSLGY